MEFSIFRSCKFEQLVKDMENIVKVHGVVKEDARLAIDDFEEYFDDGENWNF